MLKSIVGKKNSNEEILRRALTKRNIMCKSRRKKQAKFIGHVMGKGKLKQLVNVRKIEGEEAEVGNELTSSIVWL